MGPLQDIRETWARFWHEENASVVFLQRYWWLIAGISIVLVVPCVWHRHLEAGDLASHTYNAWLAQLIAKGQAPGLFLMKQWNNVLFDLILFKLTGWFGFAIGEKAAVALSVLVFFWGAFSFVSAAARRAAWFLVPGLAMIAYGWTMQMGFLNYYLSLGFAFFALAILWRGAAKTWVFAILCGLLCFLAHPMGFAWLVAAGLFIKLAEWVSLKGFALLMTGSFLSLIVLGPILMNRYQGYKAEAQSFLYFNGTDQLELYGDRYAKLALLFAVLCTVCFLYGVMESRKNSELWHSLRIPLGLWMLAVFSAYVLPEGLLFPNYKIEAGYLIPRLTSITAVLLLATVNLIRPKIWHPVGMAVCSVAFFGFLYKDTEILDRMESQAEVLVQQIPQGERVVQWIPVTSGSRIFHVSHFVDRVCVGRCFMYWNYEPYSRQFRIRVSPGSRIAADGPAKPVEEGTGRYVVQQADLPLAQIYSCTDVDPTRLCLRELRAGDKILVSP